MIIASHYPFYNKKGMYFAKIFPKKSYIVGIEAEEKYPGGRKELGPIEMKKGCFTLLTPPVLTWAVN